jgi:hypothetical protein
MGAFAFGIDDCRLRALTVDAEGACSTNSFFEAVVDDAAGKDDGGFFAGTLSPAAV